MGEPFYFTVIGLARTLFKAQGLKFTVSGWENVPKDGGAVVAVNHTGYLDFLYAGIPFRLHKRYVRYMAKAEAFKNPIVGAILNAMHHIPVDRIDGHTSLEAAVEALKSGELVGIFPESTVSRSFEIKSIRSGAVRMSAESGTPIVPVIMFGSQRVLTKGHKANLGRSHTPIHIKVLPGWRSTATTKEEVAADTTKLREQMQQGLDEVVAGYVEKEGPLPPEYWVPARFGGTAPTLDETEKAYKKVEEERSRVRTLRDDLKAISATIQTKTRELYVEAASDENLAKAKAHLDNLLVNVSEGLSEGQDKITAAGVEIREAWENGSMKLSDESLQALALQTKQVYSKLPFTLPKTIELISCDVDGTILRSDGTVSERTAQALVQAPVPVVLATGRPLDKIDKVVSQLPFKPLCVLANGAMVWDSASDRVLYRAEFDDADVQFINSCVRAVSDDAAIAWSEKVKCLVSDDQFTSAELCAEIATRVGDRATVTWSAEGGFAEISVPGVNKSTGLAHVLEYKGVSPKNVLAFGDMPNDIELFEMVGTSVAMGNAVPEALEKATLATATNDEDGVAVMVERLTKKLS
ncbi:HAD-IIB family hydrolase [Corynebacterium pyruviciproducens]|uniref:HAD-IIB family hydrolase n=1 Tax=Corynebacterium pyruviciproducens TaxID=598660 RepID=A0AAF0YVG5_9CORY|nr:HAD-IIB family hydrolase [Corynebacterium pyruviciproducens]MDK6566579.1 HAD-IIB family hydrolase [Corynebacterium pyruviciproducens]MDK7214501.1 HAD-IIB family hydrolase [Corynebacterium pyruviciproducens]WOT02248.1 HAD-IIB family hydrolase [Corynebacterium pyruviciproducens]